MSETAVIEVREWVTETLTAAGHLCETIPVPRGWTPPYVGLASTAEQDDDHYNQQYGHAGRETLHCWGSNKAAAQELYRSVHGILHRERFEMGGHRGHVRISYITDLPDPAGLGHQVIAHLRALSQET